MGACLRVNIAFSEQCLLHDVPLHQDCRKLIPTRILWSKHSLARFRLNPDMAAIRLFGIDKLAMSKGPYA